MNSTDNTKNKIYFNNTEIESQEADSINYYTTVEQAFDKMSSMQKKMTLEKITTMEQNLSNLEKELSAIIDEHHS